MRYQITLIDVEVEDEAAAKLAGLGAASRILSCGGNLRGLAIQGPDGRMLDMGPEEILTNRALLQEAAHALMRS